jgi:phosphopantothenoylcysteine decarboxylase/phosphopantothenate--cysteine ligase
MLKKVNILLGVSGGIAAYKSAALASLLVKSGARVRCILTENACKLITPRTFEAITSNPVITSMWEKSGNYSIGHINILDDSDIIAVAPATANIIAKAANGIADDMLSTTLCAGWQKPVVLAPAMNTGMWTNPATQRNIALLKAQNWQITGPESGRLACGIEDIGRMSEPETIFKAIEHLAASMTV